MAVNGHTKVTAEANGVTTNMDILISDDIQENMLVSCDDLIKLQVIPEGFPNVLIKKCRAISDYKSILIEEYPNVLSDELSPTPMKTEKPMHIHLRRNATPTKVTSARRVPLRYEAEANKTIEELIKRKVIVPETGTTDWCSPAFFVPKGDKIRVRLVTDYTQLNKHVNRPIHLFAHTSEILQAIPPEAKFFAKLDAVHGYFQLGLDEKSLKLTTFLLPPREVPLLASSNGA